MDTAIATLPAMQDRIPGVVYPPPAHVARYAALGVLGRQTLVGALRAAAAAHGPRPAIVCGELRISHAELDAQTDRLAAALLRLGLRPLDRVVMHLLDGPELLVAFIATLKAGLIPICTLAAHRESEIGQLATQAGARLIWAQDLHPKFDHVAFADAMAAQVPSLRHVLTAGGPGRPGRPSLGSLVAGVTLSEARRVLSDVRHDPWQVAVFQLSGGTTGTPKIIPRFHGEYAYNLECSARFLGLRSDDSLCMPTPLMHNLHIACGWGPVLLSGGAVVLPSEPGAEPLVATLARERPSWLCLPPPVLARAQELPQWSALDLPSHVRGLLTPFNARGLRQTLRVPAFHVFGMTEGVIMFTRDGDPEQALNDTVGRPVSEHDEVRLLRPGTEQEVAPGETGELAIRGPYTLFGYYHAEDRNRQAFTSDGWYRSGDLMAACDIDGRRYYAFKGRLKDVVDRAGEKINAEEVEQAVMRCGTLLAVSVIGVPDPVFTERVCACVMPAPGMPAPDVGGLGRHLAQVGLARFKWPERVEVFDALPLTKSGKPDKNALRQLVAARMENPA